jgi:hypothetical protein
MSNVWNKTKLIFEGKPVRIIIALLIIAGIMTGVAFGIIALMRVLSDPCPSGKHMDTDLKICVYDNCPNTCGADINGRKKGDCLPDNYCSYSEGGVTYQFDSNSCECIGSCSESGQEARTANGKKSTAMNDGSAVEPLTCGYYCDLSSSKICKSIDDFCGKEILENGINADPDKNCFDNSNFEQCGNSEIVCPRNECTTTSEGLDRCLIKKCGIVGSQIDKSRVPCISNNDCSKDNTNNTSFTCNHSSSELESKHFQNIGICDDTDIDDPTKCIQDYDKIGEDNYGNVISCKTIGISNLIRQCPDTIIDGVTLIMNDPAGQKYGKACLRNPYKLCSTSENEWQVNPLENNSGLCESTYEPCSIGEECSLKEYQCCKDHIMSEGQHYCCLTDIDTNPGCLLTTTLPYDASFLNLGSLGESINTPQHKSIMEDYNKKFRDSLGKTGDDKYFKLIDGSYIEGGTPGKLYGQCGSKIPGEEPLEIWVSTFPKHNSKMETNICSTKSKCRDAKPFLKYGNIGTVPICYHNNDPNDKWWSNDTPKTSNRAIKKIGFVGSGCENPTDNINNILLDDSGIDGWDFGGVKGDYKNIDFKVNCNDMNVELSDSSPNWTQLNKGTTWTKTSADDFTKSGNYISSTADGGLKGNLGIFKPTPCPTNWYSRFFCSQSTDDQRCNDCNIYKKHCPGNLNSFPEKMVRSPRAISKPSVPSADLLCHGMNLQKSIKFVNYKGKVCNVDPNGDCIS